MWRCAGIGIIRIYDIVFDQDVLFKTDEFIAEVLKSAEFQKRMSTAELHWRLGRYVREREKLLGTTYRSLIWARPGNPGCRSTRRAPGDSSLGHGPCRPAAAGLRGRL